MDVALHVLDQSFFIALLYGESLRYHRRGNGGSQVARALAGKTDPISLSQTPDRLRAEIQA
jgi:hypothetical protein